ncbi:MAG: four helix bundle protein [Thermodesulfovibrionales bacterium]
MHDIKRKDEKMQSYRDLEIYLLAKELSVKIHMITLNNLPRFEMYEEGSQIRRSSKSVVSNIVEGFGRRKYKNEFIQFLTYALASCDETKAHLEMLYETNSLKGEIYQELSEGYERLGSKIYNFRETVIERHNKF